MLTDYDFLDTGGIVTVEAQAVPASFTGSIANGITTTALPRELSLRAFRIVPGKKLMVYVLSEISF